MVVVVVVVVVAIRKPEEYGSTSSDYGSDGHSTNKDKLWKQFGGFGPTLVISNFSASYKHPRI